MLLVLALFFTVGAVSAADGDMIYVNGSSGNDANDGFTPTTAKLTIGNAVGAVNENGQINIADGTYTGTSNTGITISKSMTLNGQSKTGTIIDGAHSAQIFYIPSDVTVTLQNLSLINGRVDGSGGAIDNDGTLTVNNCIFTGNTAHEDLGGGAIFNYGTATFNNCIFTGNTAQEGCGGGAILNYDKVTLTSCIFIGNTATGGGAICNYDKATLMSCSFTGNTAIVGGAIFNDEDCSLTVNFSRIVANTASMGAAIYNNCGNVNAEYNWWGFNNGPGRVNYGNVDADPWLKLSIIANPTEIFNTKNSQVTADLYTDSNGVNHSSESAKYPAEIPITFATTWGSIKQSLMKYGTVTVTFTANGGKLPPNQVTVSAADSDNPTATVTTPIKIKPVPVTVKATRTTGNAGNTANGPQITAPSHTTVNNTSQNPNGATSGEIDGNWLLSYWWIIILLLIAGGLLWFLLAGKRRKKKE